AHLQRHRAHAGARHRSLGGARGALRSLVAERMSVAEISKGKPAAVAGRRRPLLAPLRGFAAAPGRGFLLTAGSIAIAFLSWQVLSTFIFSPSLIPPPLEVIRTAIPMILSGEILADVSISMSRVLVGFTDGS